MDGHRMSIDDDTERRSVLRWLGALPPSWHAQGACRDHPNVEWFPTRGQASAPAKTVCSTCRVRDTCLAAALEHGERFGIWGGTSERERRRLRQATP
jgi:WhiB family redox-sensing transcriptional regulator